MREQEKTRQSELEAEKARNDVVQINLDLVSFKHKSFAFLVILYFYWISLLKQLIFGDSYNNLSI